MSKMRKQPGSAKRQSVSVREIKTKIDLSHISKPGDVLKAITSKPSHLEPIMQSAPVRGQERLQDAFIGPPTKRHKKWLGRLGRSANVPSSLRRPGWAKPLSAFPLHGGAIESKRNRH
jgi:hypothetical protein